MQNRNTLYITIAALLAVGALLAGGIYWGIYSTSTFNASYDDPRTSSEDITADISPALPETDSSSRNSGTTAPAPPSGQVDQPYIMNLINSSNRKQPFGSFRVLGILCNDSKPESSNATIEDMSDKSNRIYPLNATLPDGSKLVVIKQDYVVQEKDGLRRRLYIRSLITNRSEENSVASGNSADGFEKINENEYNLNPYQVFTGEADKVLDFSMKLSGDNGIKISNVGNNSLARNLGLQEGDVLLAVNKQPVDSLFKSLNASVNAYNSDDLELQIQRGGRVITVTYHLFWEGQGSWTTGDILNSRAVSSLLKNGIFSNLF